MKPIFLLSLPRSGSTLLQRMLAGSDDVATAAEPWLLLPFAYALRHTGVQAEYGHWTLAQATEDFAATLPRQRTDYLERAGQHARELYATAAGPGVRYFLDKTPRYHLIVDEIAEMFPDAKFIVLRRNPLALTASMMESWGRGKWNLHHFNIDLYRGLDNLIAAQRNHAERCVTVNFEQLLQDPQGECERLGAALDLTVNETMWSGFAERQLPGRMGDRTGSRKYSDISIDGVDKWQQTWCNPLRRAWGRRYLKWIGDERLDALGYSGDELRAALARSPGMMRFVASDAARIPYGALRESVWRWFLNRTWP